MVQTQPEKEAIKLEGLQGFVEKLVESFTKEQLDYAFTGALAASFYGVPRTTADIDVLVNVQGKNAKAKLTSALRAVKLEVEEKKIDDALASGYRIATFNCRDSPYRVDVILTDKYANGAGT